MTLQESHGRSMEGVSQIKRRANELKTHSNHTHPHQQPPESAMLTDTRGTELERIDATNEWVNPRGRQDRPHRALRQLNLHRKKVRILDRTGKLSNYSHQNTVNKRTNTKHCTHRITRNGTIQRRAKRNE